MNGGKGKRREKGPLFAGRVPPPAVAGMPVCSPHNVRQVTETSYESIRNSLRSGDLVLSTEKTENPVRGL